MAVQIFPNPVQNDLTVDVSSGIGNLQIEVFDVLGRSVFAQYTVTQSVMARDALKGSNSLTINTLAWQTGAYFLKITAGQKVFQRKIFKQ